YESTSARRRRGRAPWVVLGALAALGAGGLWLPEMTAKVAYAIESGRAEAAQEELHYARQLSTAFENVATALRPSVVSVYTVRQAAPRREIPFSQLPEPFREFFGDDLRGRLFRQGPPIEAP